ncbi:L-rhamnono-gamma-lactonase [Erysiphe necator]|nr:L-rhamnono-gamma-lactonase [Erysiphe necator]
MTSENVEDRISIPIIDSHVHLYPSTELNDITWFPTTSSLYQQYSLDDYLKILDTKSPTYSLSFTGFIFLEVDRRQDFSTLDAENEVKNWEIPLREVEFAKRVALGTPLPGEGHSAEQAKLCRGIIPWAPIASGEQVLERYLLHVKNHAGDSFSKIRGFRYLVHDKPRGVMLEDNFIQGLKWLGRNKFVFDLGIDQHRRGKWQLEEAITMIERAHDGVNPEDRVHIIINHLCKPNLSIYNQSDPVFIAWRTAIFKLSKFSNTYLKLSGGFSEMSDTLKTATVNDIFDAMQPYLAVTLATFGPSRIMFGSDWPVCTVGVVDAWRKWFLIVQRFCSLASLTPEEMRMIFSGTAIKAYGLEN